MGFVWNQALTNMPQAINVYEWAENLNFLMFTISVKLEGRKKFPKEARIGLAQDLELA